ncbi:MAG: hypothetical protein IH588_10320 [Anaerolineales bacterium]|nr:hypothetical protein [Anaerolineales bacterium]
MKKVSEFAPKLKYVFARFYRAFLFKNKPKIFCISLQRTGTTSTGQFFKDHGYPVATYGVSLANAWTSRYWIGDYESIFRSYDFRASLVFEDDPWWLNDFYKVLYHRFPNSKFILLERDADKWFDSMVSHSKGKTLGNTHIHCAHYQRLKEFHDMAAADKNIYTDVFYKALPLGEAQREHYTSFYSIRNKEVNLFFQHHDPSRLFNADLVDEALWKKMANFFHININEGYNVHLNKSKP